MAEQLVAVGLGFIVLAWVVQAYSSFVSKKWKSNEFHIGFISFYALGSIILGFDAYFLENVFTGVAHFLAALFASAAYFIIRSK